MTGPTMTAASVKVRENDIVLNWTVVGDMPSAGTWLLSTTFVGGEDGPIHQVGMKALDGRIIAAFIFDHVAGGQQNYPLDPSRTGDVWTAVFPTGHVKLATSGRWKATLTLDGEDTDMVEGVI